MSGIAFCRARRAIQGWFQLPRHDLSGAASLPGSGLIQSGLVSNP